MTTLATIIGVIGAPIIWEIFKFFYPDIKQFFGAKSDAKRILYKHINSILKSGDELLGKIHSLARNDFTSLRNVDKREEHDVIYIMYLFANFWGRLMIMKIDSDYTALSQITKGQELLKFVTAYEASKKRIIDRSIQRTLGESLIVDNNNKFRLKTLYEFSKEYEIEDSGIKKLFKPLRDLLENCGPIETRQKILQFGIIIHALLDHYDSKHKIIRDRKSYENKLTQKTKESLQGRIFKHYIPFVMHHNKYYIKGG